MDAVKKMLPKKWNDTLSLLIALPIIGILTFYADRLPEMVVGAFIALVTLIVQFYFRKAGPEGEA